MFLTPVSRAFFVTSPSHTWFCFGTWWPSGKPDKLERVVSRSLRSGGTFPAGFLRGAEESESALHSQAQTGKPDITERRGEESAPRSLACPLRSLCGPSRAHRRRRGQRGACCARRPLGTGPGSWRRGGLGAGRIMQRTGEKTENEIALAS